MNDAIEIPGSYQAAAIRSGNPVRQFWHASKLTLIRELLRPEPGDRILDLGCGSGVCSGAMGESGADVLGIDSNPQAIEFAVRAYGSEHVRFRLGHVDEVGSAECGPFDKAICLEVAEHLYPEQFQTVLDDLRAVLEPGGFLLLTTPNYSSIWPVIEMILDRFRLVPRLKDQQHVAKYDHRRLRKMCENAGFHIVKQRSICTLGPWIAPLSYGLGVKATEFELNHRIPFGTILAHLYRNS